MTDLPVNFSNKIRESTCIVWVGSTNNHGYGIVQIDGKLNLAHRVAYEAAYGPIPDGMVLDHLCRVRNCVKPEHLEAVTIAENNRRGRRDRSLQVGDTCSNGHEIATACLLYTRPSGTTECVTCRREGQHANRAGAPRRTTQLRAGTVLAATDEADARAS
jgi:hypothetical protein